MKRSSNKMLLKQGYEIDTKFYVKQVITRFNKIKLFPDSSNRLPSDITRPNALFIVVDFF